MSRLGLGPGVIALGLLGAAACSAACSAQGGYYAVIGVDGQSFGPSQRGVEIYAFDGAGEPWIQGSPPRRTGIRGPRATSLPDSASLAEKSTRCSGPRPVTSRPPRR